MTSVDADPVKNELNSGPMFTELFTSPSKLLLLMSTVTVVFIFSVGADIIILWLINVSFGAAIKQNDFAENILKLVQSFSALGTIIAYVLTLTFLLYLYLKDLIKSTWGTRKKHSHDIKLIAKKLFKETIYALLLVSIGTLVFAFLVGIFLLALWITSLVVSVSFITSIKVIAAFAIALGYVLTIAASLWQYGRDLLSMSQET